MTQATEETNLLGDTTAWYQIPAIEAFPTSLSIVYLAGMEDNLSEQTIVKLKNIAKQLQESVSIAPLLRARTEKRLKDAFEQAYEKALMSYVNSGVLIWSSLNHDYRKLLKLSQVSCKLVEELFFRNAKRLERDTFIRTVVGLRVLRNVGERIILAEERTPPDKRSAPLNYLGQIISATFILWCLLSYVQGDVKGARRANLRELANTIFSIAVEAYKEALQQKLYDSDEDRDYWNPIWQEGEAEADLDKSLGNVKSFDSIEDLLKDLHRTSSDEIRKN